MNLHPIRFRLLLYVLFLAACGGRTLDGATKSPRAESADSRAELAEQVERNVEEGRRTMAAVWEKTKRLDDEAKAEFTVVAKVVHSAENRLRRSLKDVQSASADEWPQARSALAADYESYQQAIAQAERLELANAVPGSPRRERHPH